MAARLSGTISSTRNANLPLSLDVISTRLELITFVLLPSVSDFPLLVRYELFILPLALLEVDVMKLSLFAILYHGNSITDSHQDCILASAFEVSLGAKTMTGNVL